MDYTGKKVAILGYGLEGECMYAYFESHGADVTILDQNDQPSRDIPQGAKNVVGGRALEGLADFDIVSRTPPFRPDKIPSGPIVTSLTKEFFKLCPAPIIGVTGTKGKGTTSTLIAKILQKAGKRVHLVGNIGVPAMDVIDEIQKDDIVVSEISSFQLWDMDQSPDTAVLLMISEDHLDVHTDMNEYVGAKSNIVAHQKPDQVAIVHPTNSYTAQAAAKASGKVLHFLTPEAAYIEGDTIKIEDEYICKTDEVGLIGAHNLENITAAISAVWQYTNDVAAIASVIKEFKGLEHRIEFVKVVNDTVYYNDSYSSTPTATMAALAAFEQPVVLIFGGSEKNIDYHGLAEFIKTRTMRRILVIGQTKERIAQTFEQVGVEQIDVLSDNAMSPIVEKARAVAQPGDIVLLSPGNASFDMFANFKDRGEQFKAAVQALEG